MPRILYILSVTGIETKSPPNCKAAHPKLILGRNGVVKLGRGSGEESDTAGRDVAGVSHVWSSRLPFLVRLRPRQST